MTTSVLTQNRAGGVLLHITSLPGPYGIGTLGKEAVLFAEKLKAMGFSLWQMLPVSPTDSYHSPYAGKSAFAGNPLLIDPGLLFEEGLITEEERKANEAPSPYSIDYALVEKIRPLTLRRAFARMDAKLKAEFSSFCKEEKDWLMGYARYMALKEKNNGAAWYEFKDTTADEEEIKYHSFVQFLFFRQWKAFKEAVNKIGIRLIGDMPIYVGADSADVYANPELFDLSEDGTPASSAGCPPDYFAAEGQHWGNPLYNWDAMEKDGYSWWIRRIGSALSLFDAVRLDHFRGFSAYWSIPKGKIPKEGAWIEGPGMKLFSKIFEAFPNAPLIAEDLGALDDGVISLLSESGLPGMRVLQFAFLDEHDNSIHLPHRYIQNTVAYTGTHDNNTLLGWLWEATPSQRSFALDYVGYTGDRWGDGGKDSASVPAMIRAVWASSAGVAIVPVQDLLAYGSDTKMNKPGVAAEDNWSFRITHHAMDELDVSRIRRMNEIYKRI